MRCAHRFEEFALTLHPDKTRLIEFGRYAAPTASSAGSANRRPSRSWASPSSAANPVGENSSFKRKTRRDRMRAKLKEIKEELRRRMHQPIPEQGKWLRQVVDGYFAYSCSPNELPGALGVPALRDRSLASHAPATKPEGRVHMGAHDEDLADDWLPQASHPSSVARRALCRQTPKVGAVCRNRARPDLCGGRSVMGVPCTLRVSGK